MKIQTPGDRRRSLSRCRRLILAGFACCIPAAPTTATVTESLSATFAPIAKLSVPSSVTLTHAGSVFNSYTTTLAVSYRARTVVGGSITAKITTDFAVGGPSVASGNLQYTCGGATLGTPCSGAITASTSSSTAVLTLPAGSCTGVTCGNADPNTVNLSFVLADSPVTQTGSYTANIQFTVSAT
jgi:hypothetical protein